MNGVISREPICLSKVRGIFGITKNTPKKNQNTPKKNRNAHFLR